MAVSPAIYDSATGLWNAGGSAPATNPAGAAPVSSVFGRTGAVVAAANDYTEAQLSFTDITTNNVSTSKHGFAPKLPNDATKFLNGTGAYSVPPGTGSGIGAKIYDFTISGADQAAIDTAVDGTTVPNFAGYNVLVVYFIGRSDDTASAFINTDWTVNNDTSSIYDYQQLEGYVSTPGASQAKGGASWPIFTHGTNGSASYPSVAQLTIPGYAGTSFWKVGELLLGLADATSTNMAADKWTIGYRSTNAIGRIKIASRTTKKLKVGSRLIVFGF